MSSSDKKDTVSKSSVLLIGMGSSFAGMILAGFILGYLLDGLFDTKPIFIIGCGIMGFIGGLQKLHRMLAISQSQK
jgi:ATP synthase protein I